MFHNKATRHCIRLCLLLLIFTGCAQPIPTPAPVIIRFPCYERDTAHYTALAEQFHARHPLIYVELLQLGQQNFNQLAAENDVFMADQLALPQLIQQGTILDLSSFIEQDNTFDSTVFNPGTLEAFQFEGRTWGVPSDINILLMYYNKDLFDLYEVAYPTIDWTWDDFLERAEGITDPGRGVFGYAIQHDNEIAVIEPVLFIYQHGGQLFDSWQNVTEITFNDPRNVEALEWYAGLIHTRHVAPTRQQGPSSVRYYPYGGIFQNLYGMWMGMLSDYSAAWPRPAQMRMGVAPLPRDRAATTLATVNGFVISKQSRHPDAAWTWLMFLNEQMPTSNMPARVDMAESAAFTQLVGVEVADAARAALRDAILINPNLVGFEQGLSALGEAFTAIRDGQTSAEAALNAAQAQVDF